MTGTPDLYLPLSAITEAVGVKELRHIEEEAGRRRVLLGILRLLPADRREQFLRDTGVYDTLYWALTDPRFNQLEK